MLLLKLGLHGPSKNLISGRRALLPYSMMTKGALLLESSPLKRIRYYHSNRSISNLRNESPLHNSLRSAGTPRARYGCNKLSFLRFKRNYNGSPFEDKEPRVRIYRITTLNLLLGSAVVLLLSTMILPILLKLIFPMIILGIFIYQYRIWKRTKLFDQIFRGLGRTNLSIKYKTLNSLQYNYVPKILKKSVPKSWYTNEDISDAEILLSFIKLRVIEAFKKNEMGISDYFLRRGQNFDDLSLLIDKENSQFLIRRLAGNFIVTMRHQLLLKNENVDIYLADVMISVLDDSSQTGIFMPLKELAKSNKSCKMVISVVSNSDILPRQFVITDEGETGKFYGKFTVSHGKDGHREFRIDDL
ncbi:hypothetical protein KAFR_0F02210 [Kazachstania africana CBS 2517]|uniref:Uncharacterized protein n=1 Tax=Kazachstania africana (strain ATCC 22294 / BCRC 22015 / CBS 2517 / CECT 1963 / NBRC 1671 / NRRL Y-8276) TaxID=1071382 RepID=H2AWR8_KAZAF|nr:hypothetical protein KAFR_0F02210 [Kazachstania africana CBS 2517]CCF58818.1 hypothetical protein KAFR_0F02210 [Kazachstania africana CBS 2517]